MEFYKWKDTESFAHVFKSLKRTVDYFHGGEAREVSYNGKIKLHGTNASIVFQDDKVYAQKRSSTITPESDNFGFARFIQENVKRQSSKNFIVYGEWFGPGIQQGFGEVPKKAFYAFAVKDLDLGTYIIEPKDIEVYVSEVELVPCHVIPWFYGFPFTFNVLEHSETERFVDTINTDVELIGEEDPYIKALYNVSVPGEGLVFFNTLSTSTDDPTFNFKAKCEAHRVTKTKKAAQVDVEKYNKVSAFAAGLVTEARLNQGFHELTTEYNGLTMKEVPVFLKWVAADVQKECQLEMEENGFDWKTIAKSVNGIAVKFFNEKVNRV